MDFPSAPPPAQTPIGVTFEPPVQYSLRLVEPDDLLERTYLLHTSGQTGGGVGVGVL
jgi:hypothetical protein